MNYLGCHGVDSLVDFKTKAIVAGEYTFKTVFHGWEWKKKIQFSLNDDILLDLAKTSLNEDYRFEFELLDPNGELVDEFQIKTLPVLQLA